MKEKTIQTKQCKKCNSNFDITDKDLEFYKKVSPVFNWEKIQIPSPTLCPDCRQQRRLSFRNERNLYKRKCDATGKNIISIYSPDKEYKVYDLKFYLSDNWDALDYWTDFNFKKNVFSQFNDLLKQVPRIPFFQSQNENSEYSNWAQKNRNCYMIFVSDYNEKCYYTNWVWYSTNALDCLWVNKSENCYQCIDCEKSYKCFYSQDLVDCNNCYNCKWLIWKSFHIENKKYSKEEYLEKISLIKDKKIISWEKVLYFHWFWIENSTWDFLKNSKNSKNCFDSQELENTSNITYWVSIKDCQDWYVVVDESNKCYEVISSINCSNTLFWYTTWYNSDCYYTDTCQNSKNLFWCTWLRNKQYCILNKQYTKEEYNELVPKIIEKMKQDWEWWEFFPSSMSPFWYNETVAQEYFPISRDVALQHLENNQNKQESDKDSDRDVAMLHLYDNKPIFNWSDYEPPKPNVEKIISADRLPDNIEDIPDDILNWAIECEITKKPFRIIKQELEFYRKHNLPVPRRHPDQRHLDRMKLRNPRKLFDRDCDKCWVLMKTTYSPSREELVYCEKCYEKEVY